MARASGVRSQEVLIGIHIGSSSACAAFMLSDKRDPTVVKWSDIAKSTVPLRVSYGEDEDNFKWGDEIGPTAESDSLFGIYAHGTDTRDVDSVEPTRQILEDLYRKRGKHSYHLRWSLYRDLKSCSTKSLELFLRAIGLHILRALEDTYSAAYATMEKRICATIPSHLTIDQEEQFKQVLLAEFGLDLRFVPQPQASLMYFAEGEDIEMGIGDSLTVCHMEEEITTVCRFTVGRGPPELELQMLDSSVVTLGSFDVGERYQVYLEERLYEATSAVGITEGSGRRILDEIVKSKNDFLESLHERDVENSELFRLRCNAIDGFPAGILDLRLEVEPGDMRERIFDPVLSAIFDRLSHPVSVDGAREYILFSGVLGECPYVHSYMKNRFGDIAGILNTSDESTSSCQGAISFLGNRRSILTLRRPAGGKVVTYTVPASRLDHLGTVEQELDDRLSAGSQNEYHDLLWRYEMVFSERCLRQGFDTPDTKATILSIEAIHRKLGLDRPGQCLFFSEGYAYEMKRKLGSSDARQHFGPLHLAAASRDHFALRVVLAAGYSVHGTPEERPFKHFDHTPLHIYAWYNQDPDECFDLLIDAGAVGLSVGNLRKPGPVHVAASKGHIGLLRSFERRYGRSFLEEYPALLWLAFEGCQQETAKYLLGLGETPLPFKGRRLRVNSPLTGDPGSEVAPLHSALERGWVDVANLVINKKSGDGGDTSLLYSATTGREAMVRLLVRWADTDTDAKDELGQTQLSWTARLGYEAAVGLLLEWEKVEADSGDRDDRTPLSWAASCGHKNIAQKLVERRDVEADSKDKNGWTPLSWASSCGHESVVQILVQRQDVHIDSKDKLGRTPLLLAAENGHGKVVELLREKGADINVEDITLEMTLHEAAHSGYEEIARLLIERGASINAKDSSSQTALHYAVDGGHEVMARLLLENGADINEIASQGRTALHIAAKGGHELVAQLLLENGADIDAKTTAKCTALSEAAGEGHEAVVRLVLESGADINATDDAGWTSLHQAANNGDEAVVRLLIGKGADVTAKNKSGQTALELVDCGRHEAVARLLLEGSAGDLHTAVHNGHETWARLLLKKGAAVNAVARHGRTALHEAANSGHEAIAKLLLENDAGVSAKDNSGQTALHLAARYGHKKLVQLLLEGDADVNAKDNSGWTVLHLCTRNGHNAAAELLLENGADVNTGNDLGRTALHHAAGSGHEAVARLLLEKGAEINVKAQNEQTPLHQAAESGREATVLLLLENGADIKGQAQNKQTALHLAAYNGHEATVQLLLRKGALSSARDMSSRTPLHLAAHNGHEAVARLLHGIGVNINAESVYYWSPLHEAACNGHEAVVWFLLQQGAISHRSTDYRWTALHLASHSGHEAVVRLLLEKRVSIHATTLRSWTALHLAAYSGHEGVVRLLLDKGADSGSLDREGKTPQKLAAEQGHAALAALIEKTPRKPRPSASPRRGAYFDDPYPRRRSPDYGYRAYDRYDPYDRY